MQKLSAASMEKPRWYASKGTIFVARARFFVSERVGSGNQTTQWVCYLACNTVCHTLEFDCCPSVLMTYFVCAILPFGGAFGA